ncbi:MAG: hypothetical protein WCA44_18075 [Acidobacteriaceae bacterium]
MNRVLQLARLALLAAGVTVCLAAAYFLKTATDSVRRLSSQTQTAIAAAASAEQQVAAVAQTIDRPCGAGHACGTLADIGKTLNTIRLTAGQVEIAANHEDRRLAILDAQEAQMAADAHGLALKAGTSLDALTATAQAAQPAEASLNAEIVELQKTTAAIDAVTPALQQTMQSTAATMGHLDATTADVQQAVHSYLHPKWPKQLYNGLMNAGTALAKYFF